LSERALLDDRQWLAARYLTDRHGVKAIAAELGCCKTTVRNALVRHGIPRHPSGGMVVTHPGGRYGHFVVVCEQGRYGAARAYLCRCDCGEERVVPGGKLRDGGWTSCGCVKIPRHAEVVVTHGHCRHGHSGDGRTPTYRSWRKARDRCRNPNSQHWARYGGRGIRFCERWDLFENFLADVGERPEGTSLDRIDVDGDYEPGNCRWATAGLQTRNRRNSLEPTVRVRLSPETLVALDRVAVLTGESYPRIIERMVERVLLGEAVAA
jgi:hypothetical protein